MNTWFEHLRGYFPAREMKKESHMEGLFEDKSGEYKLDKSDQHTMVYFEKPDYVFIDYVLIDSSARGSGLGSRLIHKMKKKGKLVLAEVDPISENDPASAKRVRFYENNGFQKAPSISYVRQHPQTEERSEMDIFYWAPEPVSEEFVLEKMRDAYEEVHAYESERHYGKKPQTAEEVLRVLENAEKPR
ncbi:GNAT family N-acetyltransferase [Indiicoccus explosivorum]|uniref:GNAT family N-acetyltransferase n=1 Tax=Indiicoccus explosivorum TaxID=1917864 RepID=UPI000B431DC9|nr:GNAT family N-acetyltransferase [Indiicoccus explosivorum]